MSNTSKIVMPYEPGYAGHRDAEKRRNATREWLLQRERNLGFDGPSLVPDDEVRGKNEKKHS
jgi:hypothetical protein